MSDSVKVVEVIFVHSITYMGKYNEFEYSCSPNSSKQTDSDNALILRLTVFVTLGFPEGCDVPEMFANTNTNTNIFFLPH